MNLTDYTLNELRVIMGMTEIKILSLEIARDWCMEEYDSTELETLYTFRVQLYNAIGIVKTRETINAN